MNTNSVNASDSPSSSHTEFNVDFSSFELKNIQALKAQEITQHFDLLEESVPLLNAEQTPADFLQILIDQGHYHNAISFLAHAMPVREEVWWACLCIRDHFESSDEAYQHALNAAESWVDDPSETHRREAEKHAEAGEYNTPASWVAGAVFWSGGSIAPINEPIMAPPHHLYAHAISGAIIMSAGLDSPDESELEKRYLHYLRLGIIIANNGKTNS